LDILATEMSMLTSVGLGALLSIVLVGYLVKVQNGKLDCIVNELRLFRTDLTAVQVKSVATDKASDRISERMDKLADTRKYNT
jgi:hypothetical protein